MDKEKRLTMRELPQDDRPYEKLIKNGAASLSDAELIAAIIRSGSRHESALSLSQRLISRLAGGKNNLAFLLDSSLEELMLLPGIGQVKALQLKAAVELGRRASQPVRLQERFQIKRPEDVLAFLEIEMAELPREELRLVLLDTRNRVIRVSRLSEGGLSYAVIRPRDLFRVAVKANAAAVILVHNHPSGDATPSQDDLTTTKKVHEMGEMMGISLLDHLIIARTGSISLPEKGRFEKKGKPGWT
ncbi:MAG: DNA repair protein RadC [Deltaproteobacteria bacterium]|nr:DNA repair protein RadC [Deltaproteobacteria bacterium]